MSIKISLFESECNFTNHFLYLLHRHLAFSTLFLSISRKEFLQVHPSKASCATSSGSNGAVPANWHWVAPNRPSRLIPIVLRLHLMYVVLAGSLCVRIWAGPALSPGRNDALSIAIHNFDFRASHRIQVVIHEAVVVVNACCSTKLVWLMAVWWRSYLSCCWSLYHQSVQLLCHITEKV